MTAEVVADAVVVRKGEFRVPSLSASFDIVLVNSPAIVFPIVGQEPGGSRHGRISTSIGIDTSARCPANFARSAQIMQIESQVDRHGCQCLN